MDILKKAATLVVLVLATLRATRFVTTDWLGEWTIVRPLKRWAILGDHREGRGPVEGSDHEVDLHEGGWRSKLVSGLDCPFCVGFWIGALMLAVLPLSKVPGVGRLVRYAASALALNYITGHISARLDS